MEDPLKPSVSLLSKLGSIIVHFQELNSADGHYLDKHALDALLKDYEVVEWLGSMAMLGFLPVIRAASEEDS